MNTELQTLDMENFEQLALFTGANVRPPTIILPQLKVNSEPPENKGDTPMGHFTVTIDDVKYSSPTATFRPFINAFQYLEYDAVKNKYPNKSIIFRRFGDEAFDEKGGLACGKVSAKNLDQCSAQEQVRQKNIKCNRHVYGLVTFPDVKEVTDLPVLFKLRGSNFMHPGEVLDTITKKLKHQFFQHNIVLSTERKKQGSTIYYLVPMDLDTKNLLPLTEKDMDTLKVFNEVIERENSYVIRSWEKAKKDAIKELEYDDPLRALALDDDISDIGE